MLLALPEMPGLGVHGQRIQVQRLWLRKVARQQRHHMPRLATEGVCVFQVVSLTQTLFEGFLFLKTRKHSFEIKCKQVKPGFTNYQPQPKYSWALSRIEGKGKLVKTECLKIS